jgi:hypothetical protein
LVLLLISVCYIFVQGEHEAVRSELESRLAVLTKGYVTREAVLRKDMETSWQAVQTAEQVPPMTYCCALSDVQAARMTFMWMAVPQGLDNLTRQLRYLLPPWS